MDIRLVTYNEELVTPLNDALIYEKAVPMNGIFYGYDFSISGSTTIQMDGGKGLLYGREFESNNDTVDIALSSSGVKKGRLYLHMDLSNISEPIQLLSYTGDTLPELIDNPDVNRTNGVTELELCTFDVGTTEITNIVKTVQVIQTATHKPATPTSNGLMSAEDKVKLDSVQTGANKYTLPTASSSTLGGVKVGTNLSINNGILSAVDTKYSNATTSAAGLMSAADKTKLNSISSGAAVSGVKGNAETNYRTGNVNLTAANVGALALTGGTLSGETTILKTGDIRQRLKSSEVDVTNVVNGITSRHYNQLLVEDKNGKNYGNFTSAADTDGSVYTEIIARNWNTNSEALTAIYFGVKQWKDGTSDYILNNADKLTAKLTTATTSVKGLMSAADKTKLNGIDLSDYVAKTGDTMSGNLKFSRTGRGIVATDSTGNEYTMLVNNAENLWLGSYDASSRHHTGQTYISTGYDEEEKKGNKSIRISVPNANRAGVTNYTAFHSGNFKVAFGKHNCSTFNANASKTVTVTTGKPSDTIFACIPIACTSPVVVESVSGDNLAGLTSGKFSLKNTSSATSGTIYLSVAWIYY